VAARNPRQDAFSLSVFKIQLVAFKIFLLARSQVFFKHIIKLDAVAARNPMEDASSLSVFKIQSRCFHDLYHDHAPKFSSSMSIAPYILQCSLRSLNLQVSSKHSWFRIGNLPLASRPGCFTSRLGFQYVSDLGLSSWTSAHLHRHLAGAHLRRHCFTAFFVSRT